MNLQGLLYGEIPDGSADGGYSWRAGINALAECIFRTGQINGVRQTGVQK